MCTSAPYGMIFLLCKDTAELTVLLEEIFWFPNTNCILFALKNLFCICESSVRAGCDSVPPTITPSQAFICTISMAVIQLKQDLICWILRVAVTWKKFVRRVKTCASQENLEAQEAVTSLLFLPLVRIGVQRAGMLHILKVFAAGEQMLSLH